jgi:hypothetical protein
METIEAIACQNAVDLATSTVFVDEGLRKPAGGYASATFSFDQDSKKMFGLQAADLVAALNGYVLKESIHGVSKPVRSRDDDANEASLGWMFKMQQRQNFWRKRAQFTGENFDEWYDAQLLGYGVFLRPELPDRVRAAAEHVFARVWLGCTQ